MPFPAPGISVPTLSSYQFSYLGYTFGPGQAFELTKVEGLDMPDVRTGDAGRARDQGQFIGLDLLNGRTITITGDLLMTSSTAWSLIAAATVPGGLVEQPLFFNLPNFGTLVSMCRVRKRNMPIDIPFALGSLANVVLQFNATDPRLYVTPTIAPSVSPPGTGSGFPFPLTFPINFGGGGVAGSLSVNNTGNIETRPILVVTGPCTNPSITNATAAGSPNLTFNLTMTPGDQLFIDTDFHTATYFTAGSTIGATRLANLVQGSQWFSLAPGVSTIQFFTSDALPSGTLTVQYASAFIL